MKKLLIILTGVLLGISAQSAQINWGFSDQIKFNDASVGTGATAYLVCLNGITDWDALALSIAKGDTENEAIALERTSNSGGRIAAAASGGWGFTFGVTTSVSDATVVKGTEFAYMVVYNGHYWSSAAYAVTDSGDNWDGDLATYTIVNAAATTANTGWIAVPEPATAMLALAGVALLIRRRK